jgi:hypothetical protein
MLNSAGALAASCRFSITRNPAINLPTITVQNAQPVSTYITRQGDALRALITVSDSDGAPTTGVNIYQSPSTLLGSATNDGSGNWHFDFTAGAAGTVQVFSRRLTNSGNLDSSTWSLKSVKNPVENFGNTRLKHWRQALASSLSLTGTAIDGWSDLSTNATPTPGAATTTARPTWIAPSSGSNDGTLIAPTFLDATGKWGYASYDGVANVLNIAALNFPTPGASQKNLGFMVFRSRTWTNLKRLCDSIGVTARQLLYQSPAASSPTISMLNGGASAANSIANVPLGDWCLLIFEFTGSTSDNLQMYNYKRTGDNAGTAAGTTGRKEGGSPTAATFCAIDVAQAGAVLDTVSVTQTELDNLADWCKYLYQPGVASCDSSLVCEGDSITAATATYGIPYSIQSVFNPKLVRRYNIATNGETVTNTIAQFPTQATPLKNTGTAPATRNIYSLLIGINDIDAGRSGLATYNDIVSNLGLATAAGWYVIGWNLLDQFKYAPATPKFIEYTDLRSRLVAGLPGIVNYFINPAGVIPGTGSDGTYWTDNIHPTTLGHTYLDPLFQAGVISLSL